MPKSKIATRPSVERLPVARVRVAQRDVVVAAVDVVEAVHDLGDAVAAGVVGGLEVVEAHALVQLGDEHAAGRELGVHARDEHVRVVAPQPPDAAVRGGLELVVELLGDALAQLVGQRLGVQPGRDAGQQRHQQPEVAQVGVDRLGDARVLDLDRDVDALVRAGAVDLADRGGGHGLRLDVGEHLARPARPTRWPSASRAAARGPTARCRAARPCGAGCASAPSSSMPGNSIVESTWPTFMAAPFIFPSWTTICSTTSAVRLACARSRASSERSLSSARPPATRPPWAATRLPRRVVRRSREEMGALSGVRSCAP